MPLVPVATHFRKVSFQCNGMTTFPLILMSVFLKSASFVSFTDKNFKCLTAIKILSVRMSDTKSQDFLQRTRTCPTENYLVWHDVSFCQTECLTSLKKFQEDWMSVKKNFIHFVAMPNVKFTCRCTFLYSQIKWSGAYCFFFTCLFDFVYRFVRLFDANFNLHFDFWTISLHIW